MFIQELTELEDNKKIKENQDGAFKNWAERMIEEFGQEGKNIKPLLKELKSYKNN